jgi:murein L,D-transpeptidase YcbB/YkuD
MEVVMSGGRMAVVVLAAAALSGCARGGVRNEMSKLQSQIGMLDERVTQLERTSMSGFSTGSTSQPPMDTGTTIIDSGAQPASSGTTTSASIKPSTRDIQKALKNAGFYQGAVDGKMGPVTRAGVKEFQRVHGLNDDGVVGRQTWAKLKAYVDLSSPGSGELNAAEPLK